MEKLTKQSIHLGFNGVVSKEFLVKKKLVKSKRIKILTEHIISHFLLILIIYIAPFFSNAVYLIFICITGTLTIFLISYYYCIWLDMFKIMRCRMNEYKKIQKME